ncbi:hypothetical protein LOC57_03795 [Arthrobacter sp. zg-Y750]|nr:hypothetical protein [Arthrobacter sp. zg-Y750]
MAEDIHHFLRVHGAMKESSGRIGSFWRLGDVSIGVADEMEPDSLEWRSVLERAAAALGRQPLEVAREIRSQFVDSAMLRAAKDVVIEGSIPLDAGVRLIASAKGMLRASATTSQRPRSHIAGGYSLIGDRLTKQARLGHTIQGSYIIPILMPLPRPEEEETRAPTFDGMSVYRTAFEPAERRVMRTFAEALSAVDRGLIQPGVEPRAQQVNDVVAAGVSLEFVSALSDVVSSEFVNTFSATFNWAGGVKAPSSLLRETIEISHDSVEILEMAARHLKTTRIHLEETVTGPIVQVRFLPGDAFGEVSIQTIRSGRRVEVHARIREPAVAEALEWMRSARTILAAGRIRRQAGKPLLIDEPTRLLPIEETYLYTQ